MEWHVASIGATNNANKILVGKYEGMIQFRGLGVDGRVVSVGWIQLAQDSVQWLNVVNILVNLWVLQKAGDLLTISFSRMAQRH
jgi:hypothetical protein